MQLWVVGKEMGEKGVLMTRKLPMILMTGNWGNFTMVTGTVVRDALQADLYMTTIFTRLNLGPI